MSSSLPRIASTPDFRRSCFTTVAALAVMLAAAAPATALAQDGAVRFDLPAQGLGSALRAFGQRANKPILFSEPSVRGKLSRPVRGTLGVEDALRRLIAGSDLVIGRTGSGVLVVSPAPAPSE